MAEVKQNPTEKIIEQNSKALEYFKKADLFYEKAEREMRLMKEQNIQLIKFMEQKFKEQEEMLATTKKVAEASEDTLLNVLLAIRQNEYLQAWYPPQHGFPEMKVAGSHPAKNVGKKLANESV